MNCIHCENPFIEYRKLIMQSGRFHIVAWCLSCNRNAKQNSTYIGQALFTKDEIAVMPIAADYSEDAPPCAVQGCTNKGVEWHHYAPRAKFGTEEAERWPKGWLCCKHHQDWHNRMGWR